MQPLRPLWVSFADMRGAQPAHPFADDEASAGTHHTTSKTMRFVKTRIATPVPPTPALDVLNKPESIGWLKVSAFSWHRLASCS